MSTGFPLVLLPKRVVYVDDDGKILDVLRMTMPKKVCREFIDSPDAALQALSQEEQYWRSIEEVLACAHESRRDGMGEAQLYVNSYFRDWRRFHLTGVLIVDYNMPGMDGLEVLRRLQGCPSRRVLLTGVADAEVAVRAFNSGLIQKFIPKNTPNLYKEVRRTSEELHLSVCEHLGHLMRATLKSDQIALLHDPKVVKALWDKVIDDLDWMEFVVVGEPFGLLGMSHHGPLQWLQIETTETLQALSQAVQDQGFPDADVRALQDGHAICVSEVRMQMGVPDDRQLIPADALGDVDGVFCAVIDVPLEVMTAADYGLDDVRDPEERMRALLRDVQIANKQGAIIGDGQEHASFRQAFSNLVATAALSQIHAEALMSVLAKSRAPADLTAMVKAAVTSRVKDPGNAPHLK